MNEGLPISMEPQDFEKQDNYRRIIQQAFNIATKIGVKLTPEQAREYFKLRIDQDRNVLCQSDQDLFGRISKPVSELVL